MKAFIITAALFSLSLSPADARRTASLGIYGSAQITLASYPGLKGALDVRVDQTHSIGLSVAWITRSAGYAGHNSVFSFDNEEPTADNFMIASASYGRLVPLTRNGKLQLHLKAGVSAGVIRTVDNYRLVYHSSGVSFGPGFSPYYRYEFDLVNKPLYGITLNPSLEYTPVRGFGVTLGTLACINNQRFCMAAECGILFGIVRNRTPAGR